MNEFFERLLRLEEWISEKAQAAFIPEVAPMQHEPLPPPRATIFPSSSSLSENSSLNKHE